VALTDDRGFGALRLTTLTTCVFHGLVNGVNYSSRATPTTAPTRRSWSAPSNVVMPRSATSTPSPPASPTTPTPATPTNVPSAPARVPDRTLVRVSGATDYAWTALSRASDLRHQHDVVRARRGCRPGVHVTVVARSGRRGLEPVSRPGRRRPVEPGCADHPATGAAAELSTSHGQIGLTLLERP